VPLTRGFSRCLIVVSYVNVEGVVTSEVGQPRFPADGFVFGQVRPVVPRSA